MRDVYRKGKSGSLFYIFLIFPFIRIEGLLYIEAIDILYDVLKMTAFFMVIFLFAVRRNITIDRFLATLLLWIVQIGIVVLFNGESFVSYIIQYFPYLTLVLIVDMVIRHGDMKCFLNGLSGLFTVLIVLNFLTMMIFPDGMWLDISEGKSVGSYVFQTEVYFLGKANALGPVLLAMDSFILFRDYYIDKKYKKSTILLIVLSLVPILLLGSSTGIIGAGSMLIIFLFFRSKRYLMGPKNKNYYVLFFITILAIGVGVVFFDIQNNFAVLIQVIFDKEPTLSNRTNVWRMTIEFISENYGFIDYLVGMGYANYSIVMYAQRYTHCHNQILDVFIKSGIIGTILYLKLYLMSLSRVSKYFNHKQDVIATILGAFTIAVNVMFIAEVYTTPLIIMIIYMAFKFFNEKMLQKT